MAEVSAPGGEDEFESSSTSAPGGGDRFGSTTSDWASPPGGVPYSAPGGMSFSGDRSCSLVSFSESCSEDGDDCSGSGKDIVSIGGSAKGADTALILKPSDQSSFFDLKIREVVCKPGSC